MSVAATALDDEDESAKAANHEVIKRLEGVIVRFCSDMCAAIDSGVPHTAVTRIGTLRFLGHILADDKAGVGAASAAIGGVASLTQRLVREDTLAECNDSGLMGKLILSMDYVSSASDAIKLCKCIHTFAARLTDVAVSELKFKAATRIQALINRFPGDARVHGAACKAVAALACSDVFRRSAMECGLARDCVSSCTQEQESCVLNGCMAVSQLSMLPSVACALADAGSVWPLTAVLQRCTTPLVIKHAAGALRNLCSSSDVAREQLLPSGGLQAAARIMVEGRSLGSQLLTNVAGLLWCSCKHGPNMELALRLGAFDGVVHAAGRALSVIASACMKQVVGVGQTLQTAFVVPESWVPWAAADGCEDNLLFCCCSCLWIVSESRGSHSRLLSLRVLDLISDVFEYLPATMSLQQQQQQQLLEQRAVLFERCGSTLQFIATNAASSAAGEFASVRLMAAVQSFAEGKFGGKTMYQARYRCHCCVVYASAVDVAELDDNTIKNRC